MMRPTHRKGGWAVLHDANRMDGRVGESSVTLRHPNGSVFVEVRPSDVDPCIRRGFEVVNSRAPLLRQALEQSRINRHQGRDALVLGNGPSLGMMHPDALAEWVRRERLLVIGTNNMFAPWQAWPDRDIECDYWVILDRTFWDKHRDAINGYCARRPVDRLPIFVLHFDPQQLVLYERIRVDRSTTPAGHPNYTPGVYFHGKSSGVAAILHALHMGCRRLYLLGHDLTLGPNGETHSFGIRPPEAKGYNQGESMRAGYSMAAEWARQLNRTVLNCSPISTLRCFPTMVVEGMSHEQQG